MQGADRGYDCPLMKDSERNISSPSDDLGHEAPHSQSHLFLVPTLRRASGKEFESLHVHLTAMELTQISNLKLFLDSASIRRQEGKKQSLGLPKRQR